MSKLKAVILSDLHLGHPNSCAREFADLLKSVDTDHIILNGDMLELLFKSPTIDSGTFDVFYALLEQVRKGTELTFIPGNHDHALRKYIGAAIVPESAEQAFKKAKDMITAVKHRIENGESAQQRHLIELFEALLHTGRIKVLGIKHLDKAQIIHGNQFDRYSFLGKRACKVFGPHTSERIINLIDRISTRNDEKILKRRKRVSTTQNPQNHAHNQRKSGKIKPTIISKMRSYVIVRAIRRNAILPAYAIDNLGNESTIAVIGHSHNPMMFQIKQLSGRVVTYINSGVWMDKKRLPVITVDKEGKFEIKRWDSSTRQLVIFEQSLRPLVDESRLKAKEIRFVTSCLP